MPVAPNIPTSLAYSIFENNGPGDSFMNFLYMPDTNMPAPQDFTIFAIKIVMRSTGTNIIPKMQDLRAIALRV